jgi:hypothetical protein
MEQLGDARPPTMSMESDGEAVPLVHEIKVSVCHWIKGIHPMPVQIAGCDK